jgi:hypothetical protein
MNRLLESPEGRQAMLIDGRTYALDRRPDSHLLSATLPRFREAYPSIPEAKWPEIDLLDTFQPPLLDQIQNGCVGHGGATAFTLAWLASGQPVPGGGFSPTWAYAMINGGRDQGASIGDLIEALTTVGLATAATFPESKYMLGGAAEKLARPEAANYRLDDAYQITTWEEKGTALAMGYPVADSIQVGNDFTNLDAEGFVPVDRGMGNHCTAPGGIRRFKGRVGIRHQNSWKSLPFFFTDRAHVLSQGQGYSGVVFRTVKRKPGSESPTLVG